MWLNDKEEKIYGPFADFIEQNKNKSFKFIYDNGDELIVEFCTEYESENGLELKEEGYEEYWEMAFKILKVVKNDKNIYEVGKYVLVNYHNVPKHYSVIKTKGK